ncbi:hypothetical protein HDU85_007830, partial [Gaertneriomyces sp. JEL0708]
MLELDEDETKSLEKFYAAVRQIVYRLLSRDLPVAIDHDGSDDEKSNDSESDKDEIDEHNYVALIDSLVSSVEVELPDEWSCQSIHQFAESIKQWIASVEPRFRVHYVRFLTAINSKSGLMPESCLVPLMHWMLVDFTRTEHSGLLKKTMNYTLSPISGWIPGHVVLKQQSMVRLYQAVTKQRVGRNSISWQQGLFQSNHQVQKLFNGVRKWTAFYSDAVSLCWSCTKTVLVPPNETTEVEQEENNHPKNKKNKKRKKKGEKKLSPEDDRALKMKLIEEMVQSDPNAPIHLKAIDTNRRNFFIAADRVCLPQFIDVIDQSNNQAAPVKRLVLEHQTTGSDRRIADHRIDMSNAEWKTVRGLKQARLQRESRMRNNREVSQALNHANMSVKGGSLQSVKQHIKHINDHWKILTDYYGARWHRRMRMQLFMKQAPAWDHIVRKLGITEKNKARTIVIVGDGAFNTSSPGHEPTPSGTKLYNELKKRGIHVVWQDEFRTSKLCSCCHEELKPAKVKSWQLPVKHRVKGEAIQEHRREQPVMRNSRGQMRAVKPKKVLRNFDPWGVRLCVKQECRVMLWNRDVNACINMLNLFM